MDGGDASLYSIRRQIRTRQAVLHSAEFKALWDRTKHTGKDGPKTVGSKYPSGQIGPTQ